MLFNVVLPEIKFINASDVCARVCVWILTFCSLQAVLKKKKSNVLAFLMDPFLETLQSRETCCDQQQGVLHNIPALLEHI